MLAGLPVPASGVMTISMPLEPGPAGPLMTYLRSSGPYTYAMRRGW
jgi:hypothetical protein